jgi:hypothetical protein
MLAKAEADRKADKEILARMKEEDRRANQELLARMDAYHEKRMAMLDAHQKRIMACFGQTEATDFRVNPEKTEPNPEENEAVLERQRVHNEETAIHSLKACRSETMECQEMTEACLEYEEPASGNIKDDQNETTSYNEVTEKIEPDPGMMQSAEEHQDILSEDVVVMPVKGLKKRRRGRKSTAGRHRKPKELTQGYFGSLRRVMVAGKRTSRHATVAWLKRKLFRRSGTQENCGSACWKNMSHHTTVAWRKRNIPRNILIRVNSEAPQEFATAGTRKSSEGNDGIRHRDIKELPHLRKERRTNSIKGWSAEQRSHLGSRKTPSKNPYEIFGGKITKQVVGFLVGYKE